MAAAAAGGRPPRLGAAAGVANVGVLFARRDVLSDRYPLAPPWLAPVAVLPQHAARNYELWRVDRRDGVRHGVRVVRPYYEVPLPPDLLTARARINDRVRQRATAFAGTLTNVLGANGAPLGAPALRTAFARADPEFFGEPALVDVRVLRDGRRVGRAVNYQAILPRMPAAGAPAADIADARRRQLVQVCARALHRALNRSMVGYTGADDAANPARWATMQQSAQARAVFPSLSQRAFWSEAAWRRALTLTDPAGAWTRRWERAQPAVRAAAIAAQA